MPIYNFGENQTYTQLFPNKRGSFNRRFQVLFVAFYGSTELALVTYNDFKLVIRGVQNCFLSGQCKKVNFNFSFQSAVRKIWGFCPPVIYGRGIFNSYIGILPRKTPINTVSKFFVRIVSLFNFYYRSLSSLLCFFFFTL